MPSLRVARPRIRYGCEMRVSGFTFIRNGSRLNYPFIESIRSALPICDEFVVAVGAGDDDTRERILAIGDPKIRIIDTVWNPILNDRGFVLAQQKMIALYNCTGDWAFYIEGDEVLHEDDLAAVRARDGAPSRQSARRGAVVRLCPFLWRRELGREGAQLLSPRSADHPQHDPRDDHRFALFPRARRQEERPLSTRRRADARLFHYGNARSPLPMWDKRRADEPALCQRPSRRFGARPRISDASRPIRWTSGWWARFEGTHPAVMADWIAAQAGRSL